MCAGTANTYFILRHTTAPPIPSTLLGEIFWLSFVDCYFLIQTFNSRYATRMVKRLRVSETGNFQLRREEAYTHISTRITTESVAFIPSGTRCTGYLAHPFGLTFSAQTLTCPEHDSLSL